MLQNNPDNVCYLIFKAREFQAKVPAHVPDPASNPSDEDERVVLEDVNAGPTGYESDPVYEEVAGMIAGLNEDEEAELVALMWLGRGDYTLDEWDQAVSDAKDRHETPTASYLLGTPLAPDFIADGLDQHGYSCGDYATGHPLHGGTEG